MDFVALDVETANSHRGSICAVGLTEVSGARIVRTETWLTRPPDGIDYFDSYNVALHGITADAVSGAPEFGSTLERIVDFVDARTVMAHNAAFDIGAVREGCDAEDLVWPTLEYGCTLVLSRRLIPLLSYRLPFVCEALSLPAPEHHQAGSDAEACARIAIALAHQQGVGTVQELFEVARVRAGFLDFEGWRGCAARRTYSGRSSTQAEFLPNPDADPTHPLYGETIVFTGGLGLMTRDDAKAAVAQLGASPEPNVTKRTSILVIGDGFQGESADEFHTGKATKAAALLEKGQAIEVLTESEFFDLLHQKTHGTRTSE